MRQIKFRAWNHQDKVMTDKVAVAGNGHVTTWVDADALRGFLIQSVDWEVMQFTGLLDKNGKEIYEGDILRWYKIDIEYQTHYGDNIPMGSYTEPCGTICTKFEMPVVFRDAMFTCNPPRESEEDEPGSIDCPIQYPRPYDRKELNHIFYPRPYGKEHEVLSDDEFLDYAKSCAEELGFECDTIEDFIKKVNGFEVIGNIWENPSLLTTSNNQQ